jgi:hypothetical protein
MPLLVPRRWLGCQISVDDLIADAERILDLFDRYLTCSARARTRRIDLVP